VWVTLAAGVPGFGARGFVVSTVLVIVGTVFTGGYYALRSLGLPHLYAKKGGVSSTGWYVVSCGVGTYYEK
jgi:hypothetical protein